jgi:hypothetical protein
MIGLMAVANASEPKPTEIAAEMLHASHAYTSGDAPAQRPRERVQVRLRFRPPEGAGHGLAGIRSAYLSGLTHRRNRRGYAALLPVSELR